MRRIVLLLCLTLLSASTTFGQVPHSISYQGILTDGAGAVVPDGIYQLRLKLYDVDVNGTASWTETQDVTVVDGYFNVILGAKEPLRLLFNRQLWLGISVGTEMELVPRIKLTSSAYSIRAQRADTANAAIHALEADDARTVGGYTVSPTPGANRLLVLDGSGKFPSSAIPSVPAEVQDGSLTSVKIAAGEVVKSINTLHDDVELVAGSNVSIAPSGNTLIISATPGGGGGDITGVVATDGLAGGGTSGDVVVTIANQGVTTQRLADDAVTDKKIADNTVVRSINNITDHAQLTAGQNIAITPAGNTIMIEGTAGGDITAVNTPPGSGLSGGAVTGDVSLMIENSGVTTAKLADGAVNTAKLADGAVTSGKLADGAVSTVTLADGAVTETKLGDAAVSSVKLKDGAVATLKIADNAVTASKIALPLLLEKDQSGGPLLSVKNTNTMISGAVGVYGESGGTAGVMGVGAQYGVLGRSISGDAIHGESTNKFGVYGYSSASQYAGVGGVGSGYGIRGYSSGIAVQGDGSGTNGYLGGIAGASGTYNQFTGQLGASIGAVVGVHTGGTNWAVLGSSAQACFVNGGFYQTGGVFQASPTSTVWTTNKPATVKLNNGSKVKLFAEEATVVVFSDYGEGQLINGRVHIALDPEFLQTVTIDAKHPLKVFVQLEDDCNGVYITNKSSSGFDVAELQRGQSNARFSYRVVCKRKYYEDERLASEEEDVSFNANMLSTAWPEVIAEREAMNEQVQQMKQKELERSSTLEREPPKLPEPNR